MVAIREQIREMDRLGISDSTSRPAPAATRRRPPIWSDLPAKLVT